MAFFERFKKQPADAQGQKPAATPERPAPLLSSADAVPAPESAPAAPLGPSNSSMGEATEVRGPEDPVPADGAVEARRYIAVPEERFSLEDTSRIAELFERPRDERDVEWVSAFQQAAWNASIVLPDQPVFVGPDGMPYVRLELPPPEQEVQTNCLSNLYVSLAAQGFGAAFFKDAASTPEQAEYVMPTGVLESLRAFGTWDGDPVDAAEMAARAARDAERGGQAPDLNQEREVMIGTPAESYLPKHTAALLYRHLTEGWKVEDPRVTLIVDPEMTPSRNLVISRKFSDFPDRDTAARAAQMLLWYLPPRRYLLLMPEEWTPEQMKPLEELL